MLALSTGPSLFDRQITSIMHRDLALARVGTPILELAPLLEDKPIVAILDDHDDLVGVVSRTDLVAFGVGGMRRPSPSSSGARAEDIMTRGVVTIPTTATIRACAQAMAAHAIHHIYVADHGSLRGVVGAMDIAAMVREARVSAALSTIMTSPPIMISATTQLGDAIDLLSRVRVSGLVVVDEERPVGTFTHVEALEARDVPRSTPIETLYEPAVLCLPATTPLHAVAGWFVRSKTQRVLACADRDVVGIATSLDFVRYVAW